MAVLMSLLAFYYCNHLREEMAATPEALSCCPLYNLGCCPAKYFLAFTYSGSDSSTPTPDLRPYRGTDHMRAWGFLTIAWRAIGRNMQPLISTLHCALQDQSSTVATTRCPLCRSASDKKERSLATGVHCHSCKTFLNEGLRSFHFEELICKRRNVTRRAG